MTHLVMATAEKIMGMTPSRWERHANPISGWSRLSTLPLLTLAIWSRVWLGWWALCPVIIVVIWTLLNPHLFSAPQSTENWMSRGVLGEKVWLDHRTASHLSHHRPIIRALTTTTAIGSVVLVSGLTMLSPSATLVGLTLTMTAKLWLLDRMVWVYTDHSQAGFEDDSI